MDQKKQRRSLIGRDTIQQEEITFVNIYAPNTGESVLIKHYKTKKSK